jgi:hypothetical protein
MRPLQLILGPAFDDTAEQIEARLRPVDLMEASLVAQIVRAHWRLQLCEKFENPSSADIERVRHRAEGAVRRNMAELRQLQGDRHLNQKLNLGITGVARAKDVIQTSVLAQKLGAPAPAPTQPPSVPEVESRIAAIVAKEQELNETNLKIRTHLAPRAPEIGRNALCPCGSQTKYKRCCGGPAASVAAKPRPGST